jgi:AraC family transcriptional regulator
MPLSRPPEAFWAQWGGLPTLMEDWIQPPDHWKLALYGHEGVARINGRLYPYSPGTALLFPPNAHCGHAHNGDGLDVAAATFTIPAGATQPHALPLSFEQRPGWYEDLWDAGERATEGAIRAKALVWHILWSVAQPASRLRDQSLIYDAEDIVRARLSEPLRIPDIARELDVSQSTLLAWFQAEHGTTVQGFVRQTRAREA